MTQSNDNAIILELRALVDVLTKSVDSIAQRVHLFTGALYVVLIMYYRQTQIIWYAVLLYAGFWAWKEFYWDEKYEIPEVRGSSSKDFLVYIMGLWVGLFLVGVHLWIFKSVI